MIRPMRDASLRALFASAVLGLALWLPGCSNHVQSAPNDRSGSIGSTSSNASPETLAVGGIAPDFSYRLIDGTSLSASDLHGHPYVLWLMATWCSSCQGGAAVLAQHIAELRAHGIRIVQLEVADNLGAKGPSMRGFRASVGRGADAANWYWGHATAEQMLVLDPGSYPDIYYLVRADGTIAEVNGSPAATWSGIEKFAASAGSAKKS